jgi:PIN domain nuclease of toxin-antitoxin system
MLGMPVEHIHALRAAGLPDHHRDPFDRLLVAQAQTESLALLTTDPLIAAYDIEAIWAGQGSSPW